MERAYSSVNAVKASRLFIFLGISFQHVPIFSRLHLPSNKSRATKDMCPLRPLLLQRSSLEVSRTSFTGSVSLLCRNLLELNI